jgi:hypothetical protein
MIPGMYIHRYPIITDLFTVFQLLSLLNPPMSTVARSPNPLLARYLNQLATHPLRTKAITAGTFRSSS